MQIEELIERYGNDILRLCSIYLGDRQLAQDAFQETFVKAWKALDTFRGDSSMKTWLSHIAVNTCRDLLRSAWWKRTVPLEYAFHVPGNESDETICLLYKLPPKYRVVLYLHYYEQYTTPEISQLLKIPQGTVSTRLSRAREQLKKMLKEG